MTNWADRLAAISGLHNAVLDLVEVFRNHLEEIIDAIQCLAFLPAGHFADSILACRLFALLT